MHAADRSEGRRASLESGTLGTDSVDGLLQPYNCPRRRRRLAAAAAAAAAADAGASRRPCVRARILVQIATSAAAAYRIAYRLRCAYHSCGRFVSFTLYILRPCWAEESLTLAFLLGGLTKRVRRGAHCTQMSKRVALNGVDGKSCGRERMRSIPKGRAAETAPNSMEAV